LTAIPSLSARFSIPQIDHPFTITRAEVEARGQQVFLLATQDAGKIYQHIVKAKGRGTFHHGSLDGRDGQPADAAGTAHQSWRRSPTSQIPIQTIAPKFTGRFNKGRGLRG